MNLETLHRAVLHLPLITTVCSVIFCAQLFARYRQKGGGLHLLWWGIGMATYGLGTLTESLNTLFGWHPLIFRSWYVAGAFMGGYPLAQGSIYLLMNRRFAHASAWIVSSLIAVGAVLVFLTPLDLSLVETHRLSGDVIEWSWIRLMTPFINLYAVVFLVGGAVVSAIRFRRSPRLRHRYVGNVLIAVGALLPGIGGAMTRAGYVEALYVTELAGLLLIYGGYRLNISKPETKARLADRATAAIDKENDMKRYALRIFLAALLPLAVFLAPSAAVAEETDTAREADSGEAAADSSESSDGSESDPEASFFATTVVTATGSEADAFEISTPVSVIDAEELERKLPDSSVDALRDQPGVDVNGVGPNQARPVIRGQRGLRILFLENGLRLNNPRRQTDFGEISGLVDVASLDSVEVVRGPASVLYGTDAIGGVLNLITNEPSAAAGVRGSIGLRYGTAGDQTRATGSIEGRRESWSFNLGFALRDADEYDAPSGSFGDIRLDDSTPVRDSGVEDDSVYGYLGFDPSPERTVFFRFNRYRAEDAAFGFVDPEAIGDDSGVRIRILYPFQDFDRYTLGYRELDLGLPVADTVDAQLYYQSNDRSLVNDIDVNIGPLFPGAPDSSVEIDTDNFTDLDTLGLRAELLKTAGERNLLTWGIEGYEDDSFNTDLSTTTATLRFPFPPFEIVDVATDDVANTPNATNRSWGVFLQDEMLATERLSLTFGARYQTVETRAEETPGLDTTGLDFDDDALVGSINGVYQLTDYLNLVASYGTAFRAPNIVERLFNGLTPEGSGFQILNADLISEESDNVDLGLKYQRRNAAFELIFFRSDIDDGIVQYFLTDDEIEMLPQDVQDRIEEAQVDFVVQQRNISSLRYEGLELVVGYRMNNGITLGGNYTHIDAESDDSLNPPTGDSYQDKYVGYVRYQPTRGRYWLEYRVRHNGSGDLNLQPGEPAPLVGAELPSFTVHRLSGGVRLFERGRQRHDVTVVVDNLTDELYAEFSNASFFRPQPERTVTVSYRLGL